MNILRLLLRCSLLILHLSGGIFTELILILLLGLRWYEHDSGRWITRKWMQVLSRILGLTIEQHGEPARGLLVANHVSWLDIMAINSITEARFLSKADVKRWPIIGVLTSLSGTLYLERGSLASLRQLNQTLQECIRRQLTIVVFPEGTTTDGSDVLHFHGGLLQSALDSHSHVQPVALRYERDGARDTIAPYIDDDMFFPHLLRIVARPRTRVAVSFLPPVDTDGKQRRAVAEESRAAIRSELERLAKQAS